jgi:hypothetical protein
MTKEMGGPCFMTTGKSGHQTETRQISPTPAARLRCLAEVLDNAAGSDSAGRRFPVHKPVMRMSNVMARDQIAATLSPWLIRP